MANKIEWRKAPETRSLMGHEDIYFGSQMVGWIQKRPAYCDRGHWQVNIELPDIDGTDGFPRYYMSLQAAKSETEAFLLWRLLKVRVASG